MTVAARTVAAAAVLSAALAVTACTPTLPAPTTAMTTAIGTARPEPLQVTIVDEYPHDPSAFTQGLELASPGVLLESTGMYGRSQIRHVNAATGEVVASHDLPSDQFGEGATVHGDTIIQLTWKAGIAHTYQADTLTPGPQFTYDGEGWGLCHDSTRNVLWRSDGTSTLTAHDPATFDPDTTVTITRNGEPVTDVNELECTPDGNVWANVWHTNEILRVDPNTGKVTAVVDASPLREDVTRNHPLDREQTLNGIAYDPDTDQWYVTGKEWPTLYKVTFSPAAP